jgi:hypothetical protein
MILDFKSQEIIIRKGSTCAEKYVALVASATCGSNLNYKKHCLYLVKNLYCRYINCNDPGLYIPGNNNKERQHRC